MYLKCPKKEIEIKELNSIKEQYKSLKFVLEPITYGIKIPNKRSWSTYFFCQRVDIIITNQEEEIIKIIEKVKSEKRGILWKKYNIYYLPLNTAKNYKVGEKLKFKEKDLK